MNREGGMLIGGRNKKRMGSRGKRVGSVESPVSEVQLILHGDQERGAKFLRFYTLQCYMGTEARRIS